MPELVTIEAVTANTPVDIYYCDSMSASCVYVATVATFPYTFEVPEPYSTENIIIKIVDIYSQEDEVEIPISPTPSLTITPTPSLTPTITPTTSLTPSITPTITPTLTSSPTLTPTITPTLTSTPTIFYHPIGTTTYAESSSEICDDPMTILNYYTYISDGPISLGIIVYSFEANGTLFNPVSGGNKYVKMEWSGSFYQVQINSIGEITDFILCV